MEYLIHLAILVCMYLILAQSFNLSFGLGKLFNLAHVACYAVGAYAAALLSTEQGWGFFSCVLASMFAAGCTSLLVSLIALKLAHDYFAIGSLAFHSIVVALLINWKSVTRGVLGIPGIPRPDFWGIDFYQNSNFLMLIGVAAVLTQLILRLLFYSSYARSLRGQAEHESAALALGKRTGLLRMLSFVIASMFAGLAGAFFAFYINYIDPSSFSLTEMVFVFTIVIVGKPGSFWGVVAATVFLVLLPEPLRFIEMPPSILGPLRQTLYSVILFGVVYWKRFTLFPMQRAI